MISFLKLHYDRPIKDGDYQTDQKLPFVVHSFPLILVFTIISDFKVEIKKEIPSDDHKSIFSYDRLFYYKDVVNSIWQPPKS